MVRGIEIFKAAFTEYAGNYVIIGGTACESHEDRVGLIPRATKDIDIILIVEALSHEFVSRFWTFIKDGGYSERQVGEKSEEPRHQYYRFKNPSDASFPAQIELFSRSLGIFDLPEEMHITPIPTDADLSSLSAILMNDDYYHYTISHSSVEDGVHIANVESLIALKCKAYIEMTAIKGTGGSADTKHIKKHRNDVFRMVAAIPMEGKFDVPATIYAEIQKFCEMVINDMPDQNLIRDMGLRKGSPQQLLDRLTSMFEKQ